MILLLGSGPFQHTAFPYFLVVMNIQGKNGYNNNMSTTTRQQQHVNNTTTTTNNNNNSGDRSNSRSHNLFFASFDTAGLERNDRMRRKDAMMGCHTRYASGLKALLTTDAEDITCGQKRHTRKSGSTYLSERMPRTDATSWANALKGVVITELQVACEQRQDE